MFSSKDIKVKKRPKYNIDATLDDIEKVFLNSKYFHNRMYMLWVGLKEEDKRGVRNEIKRVIRDNLLGKEWWEAMSKDILKKQGEGVYIDTSTEVYKYLSKKVFGVKHIRDMLVMLRDVREDLGG